MIILNDELMNKYKEPSRYINGGIHIFTGDNITGELSPTETLVKFEIEHTSPKNKFFGFVISKKLTVEVLGNPDIPKDTRLQPYVKAQNLDIVPELPYFYVESIEYNEVSNKSIIKAYDIINKATEHFASEIIMPYDDFGTWHYLQVVLPIFGASYFEGASLSFEEGTYRPQAFFEDTTGIADMWFDEDIPINLEGTENLKDVLGYLAEATATICHVHTRDEVEFIMYGGTSYNRENLTPSSYFDYTHNTPILLTKITHATQLGENLSTGTDDGFHQIVWDNPFLELRDDLDIHFKYIYQTMLNVIQPITPFTLKYRGNPALELADWVNVVTKKGETFVSPLFNGKIKYDGGLSAEAYWDIPEEENVKSNPSTIGNVLKQTYAQVDKINKQIDIVASETDALGSEIGSLQINTDSINASVKEIETITNAGLEAVNNSIQTLTTQVQASMTAEEVNIIISEAMSTGVEAVSTTTGFTFNEEGLSISKSDSEISTTITEDGMIVYRDDEIVLEADNEGVKAQDLHATTFLIIGTNSRFEDYDGGSRTGCFWISV